MAAKTVQGGGKIVPPIDGTLTGTDLTAALNQRFRGIVTGITSSGKLTPGDLFAVDANGNAVDGGLPPVAISKDGVAVATEPGINLITGANVTLTVKDNPKDKRVDITIASSGSGGGGGGGGGGLVQIAQIVIASAQASVTFSGIAASYTDLILSYTARSNGTSAGGPYLTLQINGDTAAHYYSSLIYSKGTASGVQESISSTYAQLGGVTNSASTTPPGAATSGEIVLQNYAGTTFNKNCLGRNSYIYEYGSGDTFTEQWQANWASTAAVASLVLAMSDATDFMTGSVFTLYGR